MSEIAKFRCQRIGCNAMFSDEDNPDGSCTYHDSPIFHDGIKEWSCCKQRSHDFSLFMEIPGCKSGKHTIEKPVIVKKPASPVIPVSSTATKPSPSSSSSKDNCARCRQGFFCSDHGSQVKNLNAKTTLSSVEPKPAANEAQPHQPKKIIDINKPQTCRNQGCGKTFKEKDNHETACSYHPGPPVFHDRIKGWKCCDVNVKEFEEFMSIPPCAKGWHNSDPVS